MSERDKGDGRPIEPKILDKLRNARQGMYLKRIDVDAIRELVRVYELRQQVKAARHLPLLVDGFLDSLAESFEETAKTLRYGASVMKKEPAEQPHE